MARNGEADFAVNFEATRRGEEAEGWRTERVLWREGDATMVDTRCVRSGGGPAEREVPFEEVGVQRDGMIVRRWRGS